MRNFRLQAPRVTVSGFSLIELMVAMVVGLIVSLAVYGVLTANEGRKRTTTSVNDIDQVGAYAIFQINQAIRSAGSGLGGGILLNQAAGTSFGCAIKAARSGAQVLPATSTFPAPFASVPLALRMAPVIIYDEAAGVGGDVIMTMAGSGGLAEVATKFTAGSASSNLLNLLTTVNFSKNQQILMLGSSSGANCLVSQVASTFVPTVGSGQLPLSGVYYQATIDGVSVSSFSSLVLSLGESPSFSLFGVGSNNTMFKHNLLAPINNDPNQANPSVLADSIFRMQAIYGVDTNIDDNVASVTWVNPTGVYSSANLLAGTQSAARNLMSIRAVKIALVLRSSLLEKAVVSPATVTLFNDTNIPLVVPTAETRYRYRVLETTIALRNNLLL